MAYFSKKSLDKLFSCEADLIHLWTEYIKYYDCRIDWGFRNEQEQNALYDEKKSKVKWPDSAHNRMPSRAVDVVPLPFKEKDWDNREMWKEFRGRIYMLADILGIKLKPTIQWDLMHFELDK